MITQTHVDRKDMTLMQLAHYFITVENYTPIVVKGVKNEIWLENIEAPYKIIRINGNYIHNNEQMNLDLFKIENIVRQVKRKTLSFSVKTLNILLDVGSAVDVRGEKKIESVFIDANKDLKKNKQINNLYPELKNNLIDSTDGIEFVINVTNDINTKTAEENREYERVFSKKPNIVTHTIIAINIILYLVTTIGILMGKFDLTSILALNKRAVVNGEVFRLVTAAFMHLNLFHLLMNMYALNIIGGQVESFVGKGKYIAIYLFSAIIGNLLSCVVNGMDGWALGASGAIFGLMGALVYFGYHYRLYLDSALKTQIIPIIILNLMIGFMIPNIDNSAHIGGLVGGLFATMALGIERKSTKQDTINGIICSIIVFTFLCYLVFFAG